ncbi:MarC family protein [Rhodoflexus caldus]|uniref:MarC family protein n=1 Tax=Rhodoflexus caldus TaxID=2891236 RepID=UPI00202A7380|nr:MarC family protein [Rhodoflexus caldus]
MSDLTAFALLCFTSFFTILNPIGVMPVFMTMTADLDSAAKTKTARKAALTSFITMVTFAFTGKLLFQFFNISADSFRVVGGIIFFSMGYEMLQARLSRMKVSEEDVRQYVTDISITPLAIPMICGPGAITNSIVLMESAGTFEKKAVLIGMMALVNAIVFVVLWGSAGISKALGDTGNKILMRLMGLIVMVIAVEFFFSGLRPILRSIFNVG